MSETKPTLTKSEQNVLRGMVMQDTWDTVEHVRDILLERWKTEKPSGMDGYSELKSLHTIQGRIEGLQTFFDILERQALD